MNQIIKEMKRAYKSFCTQGDDYSEFHMIPNKTNNYNHMNYTTILNKGEALLLWVYKNIKNKFTGVFSLLKNRFPVIEKYPVLKYSLIPVLIALFFAVRYILKFVINEFAAWTSGFVGETAGYSISERTIILSIAAAFITVRVVLKLRSSKKKKEEQLEI